LADIRTPSGGTREVDLTASEAIRAFCTECMGWETHPRDCADILCPLWPRRGRSMAYNGKRKLTEEQRAAAAARLEAARAARQ